MSLTTTLAQAAAGMAREEMRRELITQNISQSGVPTKPGEKAYERQLPIFAEILADDGTSLVKMVDVAKRKVKEIKTYDPTHYAADKEGYVSTPDIEPLMEMQDMFQSEMAFRHFVEMVKNAVSMEKEQLSILDKGV